MSTRDYRPYAYVIILLGLALAGLTALVPQYAIGYRLEVEVLFAMLAPYVVYAALTETLRGQTLLVPGVLMLAVSAWLYIQERLIAYDAFADGRIYWLPVLSGALVLGAAYLLRPRKP